MNLAYCRGRKDGIIIIIGILFSSVYFILESYNPDIAHARTPQPISANPPLPNWDKLCTSRDYSANIGTALKPELHGALDIPVPEGTPVLAPMNGTVVGEVIVIGKEGRTGYQSMGGSVLYIRSTDGSHLFDFGHLKNGSLTSFGRTVKAGDQIALSGNTGTATNAPHLHFSYHTRVKDPVTNEWTPFSSQDPYKVVRKLEPCG
jgi:murein DD-endopeptidase MepM/ murein hydrolase activator NlpD